ncbi:MAG: exodeoxyribonuclease VII large subunit [Candidatus Omnitrophica bacterium]|nr:exodeoxyribonuclease VII large subunit [Candidatus Omnitrophota bacterium]
METVTLKQFLEVIRDALQAGFPMQYRVTAEIASFRVNPNSGHCYVDLVEKEENAVTAKTGAVIWKGRLDYIRQKFSRDTGQQLKEGLKVLLVAEVSFHEVYGFKLNIIDIDPSYTIGEFALHRKKIIERLEKEGVLDNNKQLPFPLVPQRIAVISSASAAGYEDFLNTLQNNPYGYAVSVTLFPAYMQGGQTEQSVILALGKCLGKIKNYDVAVIIRGGGDQVDLHSFDNYNIGAAVAKFPIPVLSGIGHRRDETVVDIVAHKRLISPTAAAEFIIGRMKDFEDRINGESRVLADIAGNILFSERGSLEEAEKHLRIFTDFFFRKRTQVFKTLISDFRNNVARNTASAEFFLKQSPVALAGAARAFIKGRLNMLERNGDRMELMNPLKVLKRGYSITFSNGKAVKDADTVKNGDRIATRLYKGTITSIIEKSET